MTQTGRPEATLPAIIAFGMASHQNVLVTGGAGYIGSHTCKRLASQGYTPVVFDNLSEGHAWAVKFGPLVQADVADRPALEAAIREYDIKSVIHFAANAYVGESVENPRKYYQNNCVAMLNLLDTMVDLGVPSIIFSSSCATYGPPDHVPLTEDHPQRPMSPYGETKLFGERFLAAYSQAYGLKHVALRYFNAAGADLDGELGEVHDPETHLIPNVLKAALGTKPPIKIFGTDYATPDGTCVRDYIHVADLADAHVRALEYLGNGGQSTQLNLGTGIGTSVREVIDEVESVSGRKVPFVEAPRRAGDPPGLYADPTKAGEILGWKAQYADIRTIVESAWNWEIRESR